MAPDFCRYMGLRHALVVRNAPSRWMRHPALPLANGKVLDRVHDLDARVGDQNVHPSKCRKDFFNAGIHLAPRRDIHADTDYRLSVGDLRGGRLGGFKIEIGDSHAAVGLQVAFGNSQADAACSPGHECHFAVECHDECSICS